MLLENCNYACYPTELRRWYAELTAGTTTFRSAIDVEADLLDGSGETTVTPLDNELYAQVRMRLLRLHELMRHIFYKLYNTNRKLKQYLK